MWTVGRNMAPFFLLLKKMFIVAYKNRRRGKDIDKIYRNLASITRRCFGKRIRDSGRNLTYRNQRETDTKHARNESSFAQGPKRFQVGIKISHSPPDVAA